MEQSTPNYWGILPANVRYDKTIPAGAKVLYSELSALCNKEGYCWASNGYFAELYDVGKMTISTWIKKLSNAGYIKIEYNNKDKNNTYRKIYTALSKKLDKNKERKTFTPPTLEECKKYNDENNLGLDVKYFYKYFTEGKWIDSRGNHVKSWKQKMLTWSRNNKNENKPKSSKEALDELYG